MHYAGDAAGIATHGVGLLVTQPWGTIPGLPAFSEAEYVDRGDWVVYAAPNDMTNPYVFDVWSALKARPLARTYARRATAILASYDPRWVAALRRRMPFVQCAKCRKATDLFMVTDAAWARVGEQWVNSVLCRTCYESLVVQEGQGPKVRLPLRRRPPRLSG